MSCRPYPIALQSGYDSCQSLVVGAAQKHAVYALGYMVAGSLIPVEIRNPVIR
jgi:hypothetical protein